MQHLAEAQSHEVVAESALPLFGVSRPRDASLRITFDGWPPARTNSVMQYVVVPAGRRYVDFDVRFRDEEEVFSLSIEFNEARYSKSGVSVVLEHLVQLTSAMLEHPEHRISDIVKDIQ